MNIVAKANIGKLREEINESPTCHLKQSFHQGRRWKPKIKFNYISRQPDPTVEILRLFRRSTHTHTQTQPRHHKNTTTKTQPHHHKNTKTHNHTTTKAQPHHHKNAQAHTHTHKNLHTHERTHNTKRSKNQHVTTVFKQWPTPVHPKMLTLPQF